MRLALISDVHANLPALEAALEALRSERIDRWVCAGDVVGYGPHPDECVARLAGLGIPCVAGNHDLMAIERLSTERADELARTTMAWTRSALDAASRAFLEALPPRLEVEGILVAHGSLDDPSEYVLDSRAAAAQLVRLADEDPAARVLVLGHTHAAMAHGERRGRLLYRRSGTVSVDAGERLLVNPGSVGQPRELRPLVRFAVLDTGARELTLRAVPYDWRRTRADLRERGLPAAACHRRPTVRGKVRRAGRRLRASAPRPRSRR